METQPAKNYKHIINATFPGYRKRKVFISYRNKVSLYGLNWSGGSRLEYEACTIEGKPLPRKVNMSTPAPWVNPYEGQEIEIPKGMVVVSGGCFCGKPATLHITFSTFDQIEG